MQDEVSTSHLLDAAVASLGGVRREGQIQMANAVEQALRKERHLAVQAGTGTGKSMAYLIPAIQHAQHTDTTVVVSTATIALQRQLVQRDLPRLAEALTPLLSRRPTFAILKGRSNYLCKKKLNVGEDEADVLIPESEVSAMGKHVRRIHEWAGSTESGDREELDPGVPDAAWATVSTNARECIGAVRCPYGQECFAELAKHEAQKADVVVTNHALLAIDALADVTILPEHNVVVVDEAHELDARITSVATNEIGVRALDLSAKRAAKLGAEGRDQTLTKAAEDWESEMSGLAAGRITELPAELQTRLDGLRKAIWNLTEHIKRSPDGEAANNPDRHAERLALCNHLREQHDSITRILEVFEEPDPAKHTDVVWIVDDDRRGVMLQVAPLSVAGLLHSRLFEQNTVVLTSATLKLGGTFQRMAASWGMAQGTWEGIDVGSPFLPEKSGILYVAGHLPPPRQGSLSDEAIEEMYQLMMAAGGRTLGLFASHRAATEAAEALRTRVPFPIYRQGEETIGTLIERFAKHENACLFGTVTLWQGVDVPGSSCSLVIMEKIPFPRPDDPLLQARKEAADAEGRNGFMEVAASHAALLMAQGAGRLLRSVNDRGVVAIMDSRVIRQRYGNFMVQSMPNFWKTDKLSVATGALRRIVGGAPVRASSDS